MSSVKFQLPWVAIHDNAKLLTCWRTCKAGVSQCLNHINACLYKIEYAYTHRYIDHSCTSTACAWNNSRKKEIEPKRISDIVVRKRSRSITTSIMSHLCALMTRFLLPIFNKK